ncbi:MAG: hypothetical protein MJK08_10660 [Campylobacterales bacterium]|nr:hypothetical protein [Campylobacterales bacterium]
MESTIALEELIEENEKKASFSKSNLDKHESGEIRLSAISKASSENSFEIANNKVAKYKSMLAELQTDEGQEVSKKRKLIIAARRKRYFDSQSSRIKVGKEQDNDVKLAALRIIAELPTDVHFEDDKLFEIAIKSVELKLPELNELLDVLEKIKKEFSSLIKNCEKENIQEMATIDYLIPIIVLHFYILTSNIKENIEDLNEKMLLEFENKTRKVRKEIRFTGFPKYQDWWIRELWLSHQAYFALFKWKSIINKQCITLEQKKAWSIIFDRWVFIKKMLNDIGSLSYNYHYAFDTLLSKYGNLDEELDEKNISSMEHIIKEITEKEDFSKNFEFHNVVTPYLKFKHKKRASR